MGALAFEKVQKNPFTSSADDVVGGMLFRTQKPSVQSTLSSIDRVAVQLLLMLRTSSSSFVPKSIRGNCVFLSSHAVLLPPLGCVCIGKNFPSHLLSFQLAQSLCLCCAKFRECVLDATWFLSLDHFPTKYRRPSRVV